MKSSTIWIVLSLLVLLILFVPGGILGNWWIFTKCSDTDGGFKIMTAGICKDRTGSYSDTCISGSLKEYYCSGKSCKSNVTACSAGYQCSGGKCVAVPGCTNECISGVKACATTTSYKTCGNYNNDTCTEWSSAVACSIGQTCSAGNCIIGTNQTNNTNSS